MTRGTLARLTTATANAAACLEVIAPSVTSGKTGFWIRRIEVYLATAVASVFSLGRPAAIGITPTTPVTVTQVEGRDGVQTPMLTATALAWGTGPTVPAKFMRSVGLPATIGTGVAWVFEKLWVTAGDTIVLWNNSGGANGTAFVSIDIEE